MSHRITLLTGIIACSLASAQSLTLPYQGTATTSNADGSAFKVANNSNVVGTTTAIRAEGTNPTGSNIAFYGRAKTTGLDVGVSASTGYGIASNCSSVGTDTCISIYSINPTGSGTNAMAGYFSSAGTGLYANGNATGTGVRAVADGIGAFAAKISSTNGTALHVSAAQGRAAYFYASSSAYGTATFEQAGTQPAIVATSFNNTGGDAIYAQATTGDGVEARCTAVNCQNGVYGFTSNPNASSVLGQSSATVQGYGTVGRSYGSGYAIYADLVSATTGYAGFFQGRTHINGTLSKLSGTFKIDHPQDPANRYLVHSFVESPEMKNVYDGTTSLGPDGTATVRLPTYFESLNENFRYQLTPIGAPGSLFIKSEIVNGSFVIAGGSPGLRVSWQVTGTRKDAWAKAHPIVVEEDKGPAERGRYLTPELVGAGAAPIVAGPSIGASRAAEGPSTPPDFVRPVVAAPARVE